MTSIIRTFLIPVILSALIIFNIFFAFTYVNNPLRVITVKNRLVSTDGNGYLKKFHVINSPEAEYDILVQPKTFWDYIFLPMHSENLASIFFQVIGSGLFLWYLLTTDETNLFDKRKLRFIS